MIKFIMFLVAAFFAFGCLATPLTMFIMGFMVLVFNLMAKACIHFKNKFSKSDYWHSLALMHTDQANLLKLIFFQAAGIFTALLLVAKIKLVTASGLMAMIAPPVPAQVWLLSAAMLYATLFCVIFNDSLYRLEQQQAKRS